MATIFLRDLLVEGRHGVHPHEKTERQPFKINIEIEVDTSAAQQSDNLADTIDYDTVRKAVIRLVQNSSFDLMERLAQAIADELMSDPRIQQLTIEIQKLEIFDDSVPGVRLTFKRP
ncbi:MAG TPA: dihydroneopterin aldolase [Candidatus Saccharimonadales bacterium]|nr:dihydroneopterin aldolase [Candidatus Saccharimonadales bacterium]